MVEVGVILTLGTVAVMMALLLTTIWIVPKVLGSESEDHSEEDDHPSEYPASRPT